MSDPEPASDARSDRLKLPVRFGDDGLVPAVVQDAETDAVLMVGFMNERALGLTRATGKVHFWSRSRGKLWRKGETSGHEQLVEAIHVNCEQDSLLVTVRQLGAACHDGYATCYYRRLEPNNQLTVVHERVFDPAAVYGRSQSSSRDAADPDAERLERATRLQVAAYAFLRDNDLSTVSGTSARLQSNADAVSPRVADELRELAGALDGSHRHRDLAADTILEGSQVVYWVTLAALRAGGTWQRLRPDRALATAEDGLATVTTSAMLRADADRWEHGGNVVDDPVARCHATLALVGQACRLAGFPPLALVEADLDELRAKPYLVQFFVGIDAQSEAGQAY